MLTERYCLLPVDLRDLEQLKAALQEAGLDPAAPTYVLSECVLVYLQPQHRLVGWPSGVVPGSLWQCFRLGSCVFLKPMSELWRGDADIAGMSGACQAGDAVQGICD